MFWSDILSSIQDQETGPIPVSKTFHIDVNNVLEDGCLPVILKVVLNIGDMCPV